MRAPLFDLFSTFHETIRWCTPSIHPDLPQVRDIYANDMSISFHGIGSPLADSGVFGEATALAAQAYGADHTLFCVQGTTTSNFMVLRTLKNQLGAVNMLGTRNAHMSIVTACNDYGINYIPIEPQYNQKLQTFVPNSVEQIIDGIKHHKPNVLFLSNPTYEGNSLDLLEVIKAVRACDPRIIVYVDEGWGAHFSFSSLMPTSAMQAGADVCTQSTHKQGNSLQMNSMIHWNDGRVDKEEVLRSYRSLSTTSPSFHMLAALDATRAFMEERGEEIIADAAKLAGQFVRELKKVPHTEVSISSDPTKIMIHFPHHDAPLIAAELEKENIIPEKYEARNITLIVGFQSTFEHVEVTVKALQKALHIVKPTDAKFPVFPIQIKRKHMAITQSESISTDAAEGRICAEYVIPYPPGIPLLAPGEVIRKEHINYIKAVQANKLMTLFVSNPGKIRVWWPGNKMPLAKHKS